MVHLICTMYSDCKICTKSLQEIYSALLYKLVLDCREKDGTFPLRKPADEKGGKFFTPALYRIGLVRYCECGEQGLC